MEQLHIEILVGPGGAKKRNLIALQWQDPWRTFSGNESELVVICDDGARDDGVGKRMSILSYSIKLPSFCATQSREMSSLRREGSLKFVSLLLLVAFLLFNFSYLTFC